MQYNPKQHTQQAPLANWYSRDQNLEGRTRRWGLPMKKGLRGEVDVDVVKLFLALGALGAVAFSVLGLHGCYGGGIRYDNSAPLQLVIPAYFSRR